jgi:hypothetical protein
MQGNDTLIGNAGLDRLEGREGDDTFDAVDIPSPEPDVLDGGDGGEVSGDQGQWDDGVDTVVRLEDTDPG